MLKEDILIDPKKVSENIINFIKDKIYSFKRNGVVLGISGGIDSACITALLTWTVDKDKILGLIMPERDSDDRTIEDAESVVKNFGITSKLIDLNSILKSIGIYDSQPGRLLLHKSSASKFIKVGYRLIPKESNPFLGGLLGTEYTWMRQVHAYYRIKHRIRMVHLYYYAEQLNYLVVGTSNKSEDMVGFFVKYGDGASDIMPIANLYKTQVIELSKYLGVPENIIQKPPSPDMIPGITDELALKISYKTLDLILLGIAKDMKESEIAKEAGTNIKMVRYVKNLIELSEHMRNLPESPQIEND
ncbi:NAD(+) synthase [candidate division WOR-3 bacterium]|nr:NAD(+) synthase [candidate division WOR-3 bacterium]